jgi:hypothetical protein
MNELEKVINTPKPKPKPKPYDPYGVIDSPQLSEEYAEANAILRQLSSLSSDDWCAVIILAAKRAGIWVATNITVMMNALQSIYAFIAFLMIIDCEIPTGHLIFILSSVISAIFLFFGARESRHGYQRALTQRFIPDDTLPLLPSVSETSSSRKMLSWLVHSGPSTLAQMLSGAMFFKTLGALIHNESELVAVGSTDCIRQYFTNNDLGFKYISFILGAFATLFAVGPHTVWLTNRDVQAGIKPIPLGDLWSAILYAVNGIVTSSWTPLQTLLNDIKRSTTGLSGASIEAITFLILGVVTLLPKYLSYRRAYMNERGEKLIDYISQLKSPFQRKIFMLFNHNLAIFAGNAWSSWAVAIALTEAGKFLQISEEVLYSILYPLVITQGLVKYWRYVADSNKNQELQLLISHA